MKQIILLIILTAIFCFSSFSQSNKAECPQINLILPDKLTPEIPAIFSVKIEEIKESNKLEFIWIISGGKIKDGQRTSKIEYIPEEEDAGSNIGVAVKTLGLPKHCSDTVSDFIGVIPFPIGEPLESFGKITLKDYKFRYYAFFVELKNNPNSEGLIELKFDKRDTRNYKVTILKNIIKTLEFHKFDLTRVIFAISEADYELTELWIVPPEARLPKSRREPYQRITEENNLIIKAQELKPRVNTLCFKTAGL